MSTQTETAVERGARLANWQAGTVAGILGAVGMGLVFSMQAPDVLEVVVPSLYTLEGGLVGWVLHVFHGAVFGVLFAAAADRLGAREYARGLAAGLGYGVVLWVLTAGLLLPVWLDAVGAATELSLPYLDTTSLIGHLVYGAVLGLVYAALRRWPGASRA